MVSISDVANRAKVSVSTVSLVLNGKAEEMRISQKTAEKVFLASQELGYIPNLAAKKLSSGAGSSLPEVAFFWTLVQNSSFLNAFFSEAQTLISEGKAREMRFVIEPFRTGRLEEVDDILTRGQYNCFVVPPVCDVDMSYIDSLDIRSPMLVLFGDSQRYSMVAVDNYKAGRCAAEVFAKKGMRCVAIINHRDGAEDHNVKNRCTGFIDACRELNMAARVIDAYDDETAGVNSTERLSRYGGDAATELLESKSLPEAVFIQNDILAARFMNTLTSAGVRVPDDIEIITFGDDFLPETCRPALTSIQFPSRELARAAITLISDLMANPLAPTERRLVPATINFRESCPRCAD